MSRPPELLRIRIELRGSVMDPSPEQTERVLREKCEALGIEIEHLQASPEPPGGDRRKPSLFGRAL